MHDTISPVPRLRVAVAPGTSSSQLSALLACQRAEEPDVNLTFFEVADDVLVEGLREGHYDVGLSLQGASDPIVKAQSLWTEDMAVAMQPGLPLLDQVTLTIPALRDTLVYRWSSEACPMLDERLTVHMPADCESVKQVTSFEMMALWVAAGYGVGISSQSRIENAREWGITMRPLADGPFEIVTYLLRAPARPGSVLERFERRALQVAKAGAT